MPRAEAIMMMRPPPLFSINGTAAWERRKQAARSISRMRRQSSSPTSSTGWRLVTPALFTRTSKRPRSWAIFASAALAAAASATSKAAALAFRPWLLSSAALASVGSGFVPLTTTWAPDRARPWAIAQPRLRVEPVTSATRPSSEKRSPDMTIPRCSPCLQNELTEIGVAGERRHALAHIGSVDHDLLPRPVGGAEADILQQALQHRVQSPGADILHAAIDLGGEIRQRIDR